MDSWKPESLSIVIPVFNSEDILPDLIERLTRVLPALIPKYEVILVNDGSQDHSWEVVCKLSQGHPWLVGIDLMRNYGQHNALLCGIRSAQYDIIVTMDDDLQHPPEEIHKLLAKLAEGYDVAYGAFHKTQHGYWRNLASRLTKLTLQNAMGAEVASKVTSFRAFRHQICETFVHYQAPIVFIDALLTWGTSRFVTVEVKHDPRPSGISNYTFLKLVAHAINLTTGFSTLPLRLASIVGFFFTVVGMGILIYVVARYLVVGVIMPGFYFTASTIAIFSGAQLFALGIIGEYLARIYLRTENRPSYVIRQQVKE
jgi:undecaprenyl-phosphate 4-deoxy-4-formamido-L-arabinose transferase